MNAHQNMQQTPAEKTLGLALPTRKVESFHYTDLRNLLREVPAPIDNPETGGDNYRRMVPAVRLPFYDGAFFAELQDDLPQGVTVSQSSGKPAHDGPDDTIPALVANAVDTRFEVTIEGDATSQKPLGLAHVANSGNTAASYKSVSVAAGAIASIIERHVSASGVAHLTGHVVDLVIQTGATVNWFIVQQENKTATRLARMNVTLEADTELNLFVLNAGGKLVRQEVQVAVNGENAKLAIKGVNLVGDNAHIDVTTVLEHNTPNTTAEELFRNVVAGDGQGVFQGQIKVAQPAQKTDAQMACNTLLLTDESNFSAKPELEIFADDVVCAHGATVTDIEEDQLFYLRARGISERDARTLLIKAFVDEVVEELEVDETMHDALIGIIDLWLDENI